MQFRDRTDAGQQLGVRLREIFEQNAEEPAQVLVLGLPRGGVPVAFEVALALNVPLDIFVVRKLGAPGHEELAMGAIASGGICELNAEVIDALKITASQIEETAAREGRELERREQLYRGDRAPLEVSGKSVVLVDDGLATGYTMRAAVAALRQQHPRQIVVAVPVAARSTCEEVEKEADAAVCLYTPLEFMAVGEWYRDFAQTSDDEVRSLLERQRGTSSNAGPAEGYDLAW
jgi:putative phosphoribosyl transferase